MTVSWGPLQHRPFVLLHEDQEHEGPHEPAANHQPNLISFARVPVKKQIFYLVSETGGKMCFMVIFIC